MNFLQRAMCSVSRRKGKSLLLFLVIFVLGNVIAGAVAISQSSTNVEDEVKGQLGATATIEMDWESFSKDNEENMENAPYPSGPKLDVYKEIGASPYVKYYDYSIPGSISSKKLERFELEEGMSMSGIPGAVFLNTKGINYPEMIDIKEGKIKLADGRLFTPEEIEKGSSVAIVSTQFAQTNNLKIGDQLVLDDNAWEEDPNATSKTFDLPVQVVGLFDLLQLEQSENKNSAKGGQDTWMSTEALNTIYLTNGAARELAAKQMEFYLQDNESIEMMPEVDDFYRPVFVLNNPEDLPAFRQETQALLPEYYIVRDSSQQWDEIGGSLKKMSQISGYVVIVATLATLAIISLVVLLFMRDRKHELGVYLSLGESRSKVIGQIAIETLAVSVLALLASLVTGNFLGEQISNSLIATNLFGNPDSFGMMYSDIFTSNLTSEDVMEAYKITFSTGYVVSFMGIGLVTVALSTIAPLAYILRLNPKKIMM